MTKKASGKIAWEKSLSVGIDVSKATLDIVCLMPDAPLVYRQIDNEEKAIKDFVDRLVTSGYRGKIVLESTGRYHYLVCLLLCEAGQDVRLINPLVAHRWNEAKVRKTKTDPVDARQLAWLGLSDNHLPPRLEMTREQVDLRHKMGLLSSLEKQIQRMSQSLNQYQASKARLALTMDESELDLISTLKLLKRQKEHLSTALDKAMTAMCVDSADVERLQHIPGFSATLCGLLLTFLRRDVKKSKAWVAFVGLDVSVKQSGKYRGQGRLTKRGNSYLRKRLYNAAWGAMMNYPEVRAYYDYLKSQGRKHAEALIIIARKLLNIAFRLVQDGGEYQAEKAFVIQTA